MRHRQWFNRSKPVLFLEGFGELYILDFPNNFFDSKQSRFGCKAAVFLQKYFIILIYTWATDIMKLQFQCPKLGLLII